MFLNPPDVHTECLPCAIPIINAENSGGIRPSTMFLETVGYHPRRDTVCKTQHGHRFRTGRGARQAVSRPLAEASFRSHAAPAPFPRSTCDSKETPETRAES